MIRTLTPVLCEHFNEGIYKGLNVRSREWWNQRVMREPPEMLRAILVDSIVRRERGFSDKTINSFMTEVPII